MQSKVRGWTPAIRRQDDRQKISELLCGRKIPMALIPRLTKILKLPLALIPREAEVRILRGPLRGKISRADGLFVIPGNTQSLTEVVVNLCRELELRMRLGGAAQKKMKRYTWKETARRTEMVFKRVLAGERASS